MNTERERMFRSLATDNEGKSQDTERVFDQRLKQVLQEVGVNYNIYNLLKFEGKRLIAILRQDVTTEEELGIGAHGQEDLEVSMPYLLSKIVKAEEDLKKSLETGKPHDIEISQVKFKECLEKLSTEFDLDLSFLEMVEEGIEEFDEMIRDKGRTWKDLGIDEQKGKSLISAARKELTPAKEKK